MLRLQPDGSWWYEHIYDDAKEQGEALGFSIRDIYFSGFYSQGDGASWTGYVDMVRWLEKHKQDDARAHVMIALLEEDWLEPKLEIVVAGSYSHSNTMQRDVWYRDATAYDHENLLERGIFAGVSVGHLIESIGEDYFQDIADEALASARNYADRIYKRLEKEWDRLCSEEVIAETCEANEYLFDEYGNFV